jgi:glucokinase
VDHTKNAIAFAGPNFHPGFRTLDIAQLLRRTLRVPVTLENDAKAFTVAEALCGAGKTYARVVGITLGTGIGGALVEDKILFRGAHNLAGEIGQMSTRGSRRSWEQLAAGPAFRQHKSSVKEASLLADGLCNILYLYDPDIIVIGGGLAQHAGIIARARQETRKRLYYAALKQTPIVKNRLKHPALYGAFLIARHAP